MSEIPKQFIPATDVFDYLLRPLWMIEFTSNYFS